MLKTISKNVTGLFAILSLLAAANVHAKKEAPKPDSHGYVMNKTLVLPALLISYVQAVEGKEKTNDKPPPVTVPPKDKKSK